MSMTAAPTQLIAPRVVISEVGGMEYSGKTWTALSALRCGPLAFHSALERIDGTIQPWARFAERVGHRFEMSNFGRVLDPSKSSEHNEKIAEEAVSELFKDISACHEWARTQVIDTANDFLQMVRFKHFGSNQAEGKAARLNYGPVNADYRSIINEVKERRLQGKPCSSLILVSRAGFRYNDKGGETDDIKFTGQSSMPADCDVRILILPSPESPSPREPKDFVIKYYKTWYRPKITGLQYPSRQEWPEIMSTITGEPVDKWSVVGADTANPKDVGIEG